MKFKILLYFILFSTILNSQELGEYDLKPYNQDLNFKIIDENTEVSIDLKNIASPDYVTKNLQEVKKDLVVTNKDIVTNKDVIIKKDVVVNNVVANATI